MTTENAQQTQQIEISMAKAKQMISLGESLERLKNNRDFKKLFTEGYFKTEAVRLVLLKSDPQTQNPEHQEAIIRAIDSIGELRQFLLTIGQEAAVAGRALEADQATHAELLAEA